LSVTGAFVRAAIDGAQDRFSAARRVVSGVLRFSTETRSPSTVFAELSTVYAQVCLAQRAAIVCRMSGA
jgi:hypothetical protein